jgi:hypothetical protein
MPDSVQHRLPISADFEQLIAKARVEYTSLTTSLAHGTRTLQAALVLACMAILLTVAQLRDRLATLTLGEFPAVGIAPIALLTIALIAILRINTLANAFSLDRLRSMGFEPLLSTARNRGSFLIAQALNTIDAVICHKSALAAPTGLFGGQLSSWTLAALAGRKHFALPDLAQVLNGFNARALIDEKRLRIAICAIADYWHGALLYTLAQPPALIVVHTATSPDIKARSPSLNLLC